MRKGSFEGRGNQLGRWGSRYSDSVVNLVPEGRIVRICVEGCLEEGFDAVEVKVVRVNSRVEPRQIAKEILATATGTEQARGPKALQC